MKLYLKPGACSQAVHIVLLELGIAHTLDQVDTEKKLTERGHNFLEINPNGYVPALELDGGEVLTEGPAILQYLGDAHQESRLTPPSGGVERARFNSLLNFLSSEIHKAFGPFFSATPLEGERRESAEVLLRQRIAYLETLLADGRPYLGGADFTVADALAFVLLSWARPSGIALSSYPHVEKLLKEIRKRNSVKRAWQAEGLMGRAA